MHNYIYYYNKNSAGAHHMHLSSGTERRKNGWPSITEDKQPISGKGIATY